MFVTDIRYQLHQLDRALSKKERDSEDAGLVKSWRPFQGLLGDLRRKSRWYLSDLRDGFNLQCLAAFFFMYFAVLAPTIAFGGLLGRVSSGRGSDRSASPKIVTGHKIPAMVYGTTSNLPVFDRF